MNIQAVFFDLDGTLADTAPDLVGALNSLLRQHHLPEKNLDDLRPFTGHGSATLLSLGAGINTQHPDFKYWQQCYLTEYLQRDNQDTQLFTGINSVLTTLTKQNIIWGIITNKPEYLTQPLLSKLNFPTIPATVVCGDTCNEAKPSVKPMLYACNQAKVLPEHCLYIGDAQRDIQAGNAANMQTAVALWGYIGINDAPKTWDADYYLNCPQEILNLLK